MTLSSNLLPFLLELKSNNSREWFGENKVVHDKLKFNFELFVSQLIQEFSEFENLDGVQVKHCAYRIYRDVRFSKNKDPYKTWYSASFSEGGRKSAFMEYYLHIEPNGGSFLGGGMYNPLPEQLSKFRQEIDYNGSAFREIIGQSEFVKAYGEAQGESLKNIPKGFAVNHPDADLLKKKSMFFWHHFSDEQVINETFINRIIANAKILKPYLDFLNASFFDKQPFLKV